MKKQTLTAIAIITTAIFFVIAGICYADQGYIKITQPTHNSVISGFFLPISWTDSFVEQTKTPYPENYSKFGNDYTITLINQDGKPIFEKIISSQNYCVLTYDEIEVMEHGQHYLIVSSGKTSSDKISFMYQKSVCDVSFDVYMEAIENYGTEADVMVSERSTRSGCLYCLTQRWPGYLVVLLSQTTYTKQLIVTCNQYTWFSQNYDPGFNGPVFIYLSSGNFKASYNDYIINTYQCPIVTPWSYSVIQFP